MDKSKLKYYCNDCGKEIGAKTAIDGSGLCSSCSHKKFAKNHPKSNIKKQKYYCKECKIEIGWKSAVYGSGLCVSCVRLGKRHWNFKHGKSQNNTCKSCGTHISPKATKCNKCECKSHHHFKGGKKSRETYCDDCGKLLGESAYYRDDKRCLSCAQLHLWKQEEHRNKTVRAQREGMKQSPNKKEKQIRNILNKLFPKEYKFVGDGQVFINGFNPDFININGQKKLIEFYGDYWHTIRNAKERNKRRLQTYKKYGYKTLVIWESELISDIEKVTEKIKEFHNDSM